MSNLQLLTGVSTMEAVDSMNGTAPLQCTEKEQRDELQQKQRLYCVTGATGYLASWLVKRLLEGGYRVRGTVRNLEKARYLRCLLGGEERLELVEADLLDEASLRPAVQGCHGVFAVAVPIVNPSEDPDQTEMKELALTCTLNLLRACQESGDVNRVVLTSSFFTAIQVPREDDHPLEIDESCWSSVEYCTKEKMSCWGYVVAKTVAEEAAFEFARDTGLDVVAILPSLVGGPFITPDVPGSVAVYLGAMTDVTEWMGPILGYMSYVHVDDSTRAHMLLMEDGRAKGRYICSACDATLDDYLHEVLPLLQSFSIPPPNLQMCDYEKFTKAFYKLNTQKLGDLGFTYQFDTLHKILKDTLPCLIEKGYLKQGT